MEVTGYKFQVEQAAVNAQSSLRVFYLGSRPAPPDGETFYYFEGDFAPVLGTPDTFDVEGKPPA